MNDGGRAFPLGRQMNMHDEVYMDAEGGMSLLDYFAGKALQGMCAAPAEDRESLKDHDDAARIAYSLAVAMLKAQQALYATSCSSPGDANG